MNPVMNFSWKISVIVKLLPDIELKTPRDSETSTSAKNKEIITITRDSTMNWIIMLSWLAPETFLMPISFPLKDALAVARFIKLMQAISRINMAMETNMYMLTIAPLPTWNPNCV